MNPYEIAMNALLRISKGIDHSEQVAQAALDSIATLPKHLREFPQVLEGDCPAVHHED